MKLLSTFLFLCLSFHVHSQRATVTMAGIGDFKLGMKQAEVEKLLNQNLKLSNISSKSDDYYQDTVHVNYKGLDADLIFQRDYADEKKYNVAIWEIRSNSALLKTKSGIGIGDDKYKIINTYDGYFIWIMPQYEDSSYTI